MPCPCWAMGASALRPKTRPAEIELVEKGRGQASVLHDTREKTRC